MAVRCITVRFDGKKNYKYYKECKLVKIVKFSIDSPNSFFKIPTLIYNFAYNHTNSLEKMAKRVYW
jgi:hypothetical protein